VAGAPLTFAAGGPARAAGPADDPLESEVVRLYRAHCGGLYRYALTFTRDRQLAEDVLQESFLRYFLACKEGQVIQNARAWLYQVLHNLLLDDRKRMGFRTSVCLEAALENPDRDQDPEARMQRRELSDSLRLVLSPRELECVELRVQGLAYEEIAGILRIRPGTVGALLARALKKTQKVLRRKGGDRR
jgi:RNA polymerase sigma-70 factor (ECF subfamily)